MRDFTRTEEPSGECVLAHAGNSFVIQQHAGPRLHYDVHLELAHGVDSATFTTLTVPTRLASLATDPWNGISERAQAITAAAWRAVGGRP